MPLRGMMYFSKLYNKYVKVNRFNIFSDKQIKLPTPQYYVFYNGKEEYPDRLEMKLSEAFQIKKGSGFEWTAVMININYGKNRKLMENCKILRDYAILIEKIRKYHKECADMEQAVTKAVDECIQESVMAEFLLAHKAEVIDMCLTEYNEEETMAMLREEAREDGFEKGKQEGIKEGIKKGIIDLVREKILSKEQAAERLDMSVEQLEDEIKNTL